MNELELQIQQAKDMVLSQGLPIEEFSFEKVEEGIKVTRTFPDGKTKSKIYPL